MANSPQIPEGAVQEALKSAGLEGDQTARMRIALQAAMRIALQAAAPAIREQAMKEFEDRLVDGDFPERLEAAIRKQRDDELRERLLRAVAEKTAAPSGFIINDAYDRGRTEERAAWVAALDSIFEVPDDISALEQELAKITAHPEWGQGPGTPYYAQVQAELAGAMKDKRTKR